jgi:hypothetical protein
MMQHAIVMSMSVMATAIVLSEALPTIDWFACAQNASISTMCGTLQVPLDYTSALLNKSIALQLVKVCFEADIDVVPAMNAANVGQINATSQPSKGSILFDFGGPGNINLDEFAGSNAEALLL